MPSSSNIGPEALAERVTAQADALEVVLRDGRVFTAPYDKLPGTRLPQATAEQRRNLRLIAGGEGIHWPDLDEDLSVRGLVRDFAAWDRWGSSAA